MSNTHRRCNPGSQPSRLSQVIQGILLASALTASVVAHGEESTRRNSYHISGGSLGQALSQFARDAGILFTGESKLTDGKISKGLEGEYTVEEGFRKLLAGSGLTYTITNDNAVAIKIAESGSDAASTLPAVTVAGKAVYDSTDPYNPDYNRSNASTATKTDTPIMETPIAVQVVPKAVMHDQQAVQLGDAIKNVSGVFQGFTYGGFSEEFMIRGFNTNYANYLDGLRWPVSRIPLANAERIEVVKGAGANLYGRIEPGGMINVVTKRPQATPYYSLEQRFGSYDLYQTLADATGAINKDGSLMYRLNFEYLDKNSFRDFAFTERKFVAPSLTWKISDRTQLDFDFIYSNEDTLEDHGVVASNVTRRPINIPISRFLGEPSIDKSNTELYSTALTLNHEFSDSWKMNAQFRNITRDVIDLQHAAPGILDIATGELARAFCCGPGTQDVLGATVNVTGKFSTWNVKHSVLAGWDYYEMNSTFDGWFLPPAVFGGPVNPINIYNPQYGQSGVDLARIPKNDFWDQRMSWNGVYFQDQITLFEKFHILGGGRYDWANKGSGSSPTSVADAASNYSDIENQKFSPRVGLVYQPWQWLSLYGNFIESLGASNTGVALGGGNLQPESAEQFEAGFKTEFFDKRLTSNLAFYHLTKQNISVPIAGTRFSQAVGEARSQGIEIDVSGQVTDGLNLIATYAYTDAVILSGNNAGNRLWNVPRNAGSFWAKYDIQKDTLRGLSFGAGVYFQDQREGDNANSFELPGYGRVDALVKYQLPIIRAKTTLQFNVENLLDHQYYAATDNSNTFILPGAPRTFIGSVKVEF